MVTAISVNKYIYSLLINDTELNKLVGKKIFPLIAEDNTTFPFIIFRRENIITEYTKQGRVFDDVEFSIYIVSNNYYNSIEIAERIRDIIEMHNDENFTDTRLSNVNEDFIDDSYIQELTFKTIIK